MSVSNAKSLRSRPFDCRSATHTIIGKAARKPPAPACRGEIIQPKYSILLREALGRLRCPSPPLLQDIPALQLPLPEEAHARFTAGEAFSAIVEQLGELYLLIEIVPDLVVRHDAVLAPPLHLLDDVRILA